MLPVSTKFQTGSAKSNFWATIVFGLAFVKVLEAFLANTISTNIIWAGFAGFEHILYCFSFGAAAHHYPRYFLSFLPENLHMSAGINYGAEGRNRTCDLRSTNASLYLLSYISI